MPATLIGGEGAGGRLMGRVLDLATVSLAEEQVAGIRKCLELSVAAAKAISGPGSHVPTVLGEVRVQLEVAQVMCEHARRVAGSDTVEGSIAAAMSHISCSIAFSRAAAETVRLVAEADVDAGDEAETLFRRAQSSELLFEDPWCTTSGSSSGWASERDAFSRVAGVVPSVREHPEDTRAGAAYGPGHAGVRGVETRRANLPVRHPDPTLVARDRPIRPH